MKTTRLIKTWLACACLGLWAANALAQNYYMATQQARRESAKNDAEQQRIANAAGGGGAAAGGAAAPAAPMDPALQVTLKNVSDLQSDFAAIIAGGDKADPSQKTSLLNNLTQAAQGTKATSNSVKNLADGLMKAMGGKTRLLAAQQTKLAREIHALFNSSHLAPAQQQTLVGDVQRVLTEAGASLDDAVDVATDLKAVVADTK